MIRISVNDLCWRADLADEVVVTTTTTRTGEVKVTLPQKHCRNILAGTLVTVYANLINSDMVMAFFLTIDAIRCISPTAKISASIPYLPYSNQDRVREKGGALPLVLFSKLLNTMKLESVRLIDPYSNVAAAVIENAIVETQYYYINQILGFRLLSINLNNIWLVTSSLDTLKKVQEVGNKIQEDRNIALQGVIMGLTKINYSDTQDLESVEVDKNIDGKNLLVVESVCEDGQALIQLGKELRKNACGELNLFVTHGIFSEGVDKLLEVYDRIFTTDSFHPDEYSDLRKYTTTLKNNEGLSRFRWFRV